MKENIEELKRLSRVVNMMLTMHSVLRDKNRKKALLVDIVLLVSSVFLLFAGLADPALFERLAIPGGDAATLVKICSIIIFIVSLITLRVDWKAQAAMHERACTALSRLKGETKAVLLEENLCSERFKEHQQLYNLTMSGLCPIPENQFHKLKAKHLSKVELSKAINSCPGCPLWVLRITLFIKGLRDACRRERSGTQTEKEGGDS